MDFTSISNFISQSTLIELVALVPLSLACFGVFVAVFGKAAQRYPYWPDERQAFTRPPVPRAYLRCFSTITRVGDKTIAPKTTRKR